MIRGVAVFLLLMSCYQFPTVPPAKRRPERTETYEVIQKPDGVTITALPDGNIGWLLSIRNDTDEALSVVWDESSFVAGTGRSLGRLVPGATRRMNIGAPHPPEPLPPNATVDSLVIPSEVADRYEHGPYGEDFRGVLAGGRLILTIRGAESSTWAAVVSEH